MYTLFRLTKLNIKKSITIWHVEIYTDFCVIVTIKVFFG